MNIIIVVNGLEDFTLEFDTPIRRTSRDLFLWAISLRDEYSEWPVDLPTPTINNSLEIHERAQEANQMFLDALSFILYHEVAHLIHQHRNYVDLVDTPVQDLTDEERATIIQIENEADVFARETVLNTLNNDQERKQIGLSIVVANLSMLLAQNHPAGFIQSKHLDIDHRLSHSIDSVNFDNEGYRDFLHVTAVLGIQLFFYSFNFNVRPREFRDTSEMFRYFLNSFDDLRNFFE